MTGLKTCDCGEPTYSDKCSLCSADDAVAKERERCLNCYSPDDTVTDYQDKIRSGK